MADTRVRKLNDLFVTGKEFAIGDDSGADPVTIWMQKLNPAEHSLAVRRANAERAKIYALKKADRECPYCGGSTDEKDILDSLLNSVYDMKPNHRRDILVDAEMDNKTASINAELAAEDEWATDDYLAGLMEAWPTLEVDWANDPEAHPEGKRVKAELDRFKVQASELIQQAREDIVAKYEMYSEDEIVRKMLDHLVEQHADFAWLQEYRMQQLFYSVRDPQKKKDHYFTERSEVDQLSVEVLARLIDEYQNLSVDVIEGKE